MHGFFTGPLHELRDAPRTVAMPSSSRLDSPRGSVRPLRARLGVHVPIAIRRLRPAGSGGARGGVPTACSDIEPLASIAGDAALLFDPGDIDAIAEAMRRLEQDAPLRARLAEAGPRARRAVLVAGSGSHLELAGLRVEQGATSLRRAREACSRTAAVAVADARRALLRCAAMTRGQSGGEAPERTRTAGDVRSVGRRRRVQDMYSGTFARIGYTPTCDSPA